MSPNKVTTAMRLDPAVLDAMREYKRLHGVPFAVQIERAVTDWLSRRGLKLKAKAGRRRAATRQRP